LILTARPLVENGDISSIFAVGSVQKTLVLIRHTITATHLNSQPMTVIRCRSLSVLAV